MPIEFASPYPKEWGPKVRSVLVDRLAAIEERIGSPLQRVPRRPSRLAAPLGEPGRYGAVYELERLPGRILKITTDRLEGPYSFYVSGLQKLGVESASGPVVNASVVVFDVFQIDAELPLWGIVIERVQPVRYDRRSGQVSPSTLPLFILNGADRYNDGWNALRGHSIPAYDIDTGVKLKKKRLKVKGPEARVLVDRGLTLLDQSPISQPLANFLRLVMKDDHAFTDLHRNNMGLRLSAIEGFPSTERGQLVAFDFGCSPVSSAVRRSAGRSQVT